MSNQEKILTIVKTLLASFPAGHSGDGDDVVNGYMIGLADIPEQYLAKAAANYLQGSVDSHNKAFAPSPAEIAFEGKRIWNLELTHQNRIRRDKEALERIENQPKEMTDDERDKRKKFAENVMHRSMVKFTAGTPEDRDD